MTFDDDRRDRAVVELVEIADLLLPALLAVLDAQRDQMAVGGLEVERITGDGDAAVADVNAPLRFPGVMPQLAPGTSVERPDVIGHGQIQHAVDLDWRA